MPKHTKSDCLLQYIADDEENPIEYVLRIMNDLLLTNTRRDRMCILLMPYFCFPKRYEGAKVRKQKLAVNNTDDDRFYTRPVPRQSPHMDMSLPTDILSNLVS
jgi:hypothetical protein